MSLSLELTSVKDYLRIDNDDEDVLIGGLISTVKQLIKEQTGVEYSASDETYNMCGLIYVSHLYENRAAVADKSISEVPFSLSCFLNLISLRGNING
ncbi:MAG: head-tail connector protein [Candidatus Gastranaerophilales bacterium]|nr:head-tail connector protein [Candidatus Gastranaerophilales bacterium]